MPASRRASAIAIAPTAVLLIASASLILVSSYRLRASRDLVLDTYDVISVASSLLSNVRDAEANQRGYLITGRTEYLTPYQEAITRSQSWSHGYATSPATIPSSNTVLKR